MANILELIANPRVGDMAGAVGQGLQQGSATQAKSQISNLLKQQAAQEQQRFTEVSDKNQLIELANDFNTALSLGAGENQTKILKSILTKAPSGSAIQVVANDILSTPNHEEQQKKIEDTVNLSIQKGYLKPLPEQKKGKWQPWGFGQMRNTETGDIEAVPTAPREGEEIRALPGGGFEIIRGDVKKRPKKFSEVQTKAGGFATRVEAANEISSKLEDKMGFDPASIKEALKGKIPLVGNMLSSEDMQVYNQAKSDFVTAVLRLESGAAISPAEFEKEDKKYFPQPGDKPAVIENKRKARERQFKILRKASGGSYEAMTDETADPLGIR